MDSHHPWDVRTCGCGRLTVSGGPKHRRVQWRAEPGTGWTDLTVESEDAPEDDRAADDVSDSVPADPGSSASGGRAG